MTITPADVLTWTGCTVTQQQLDVFGPAAEIRLDADGGTVVTGQSRIQLLSYLVAGYLETASGSAGKHAETIGNYSYTRTSSTGTSVWIDLYRETLKTLRSAIGAVGVSPLVDRVDTDILSLNREFSKSSGRLI